MIGLFHQKYHVAVYGEDASLVNRIVNKLRSWFKNEVVVESYTDTHQMLVDFNVAQAKNKPFDMAILGPEEGMESKIFLKHTNPLMDIIGYKDEKTLKKETVRLSMKRSKELRLVKL